MGPLIAPLDRWVSAVLTLLAEVEAGARPAHHLRGVLADPLVPALERRPRRRGAPAAVLRVRGTRQRGRWHIVGLVQDGRRVRAVVMEVAERDARPLVVVLGWPETGSLAPVSDLAAEPAGDAGWTPPRRGWTLPDGWRRPAA